MMMIMPAAFMVAVFSVVITIMMSCLLFSRGAAAQQLQEDPFRITARRILRAGENEPGSIVIDPSERNAYIGASSIASAGYIVQLDLRTLDRVGVLFLPTGEEKLRSAVASGNTALFGIRTTPGAIVRVQLDPLQRMSKLALDGGENNPTAAASDGTFAYFCLGTSPARIVRVRFSNGAKAGSTLVLDAGDIQCSASAILNAPSGTGPADNRLYAIMDSEPSRLVEVNLTDFGSADSLATARMGVVDFNSNEEHATSCVLHGNYVYVACAPVGFEPLVVKVQVWPTRARIGALTLPSYFSQPSTATLTRGRINTSATYIFFGSQQSPAQIVRVTLEDFNIGGSPANLTLESGENTILSAAVAQIQQGFILYGLTSTQPGKVLQQALSEPTATRTKSRSGTFKETPPPVGASSLEDAVIALATISAIIGAGFVVMLFVLEYYKKRADAAEALEKKNMTGSRKANGSNSSSNNSNGSGGDDQSPQQQARRGSNSNNPMMNHHSQDYNNNIVDDDGDHGVFGNDDGAANVVPDTEMSNILANRGDVGDLP